MISRLILVGLVAVLGVSLPSRSESGGWLTSAHAWAIARLADWDTYSPGEDSCFIVTKSPDSSPCKATQAETRKSTTTSVPFEPISIDDDLDTELADELNRMADGLDITATSTAIAESPTDIVAVPPSDSIELKLVVELCRIDEAPARDETVSSPAVPQLREATVDPAIDELFADASNVFAPSQPEPVSITQQPREANRSAAIDELFADASNVFAPSQPEPASITQPKPVLITAGPKFESIKSLVNLAMDTAAKWYRFAEAIPTRLEDAASRSVRISTIEPIKVPADLESGLAYELNLASEGLEIVSPEVRTLGDARPSIPGSEPAAHSEDNHDHASIGKALCLTRDAASAWMNVLSGMTPVTMSSR